MHHVGLSMLSASASAVVLELFTSAIGYTGRWLCFVDIVKELCMNIAIVFCALATQYF